MCSSDSISARMESLGLVLPQAAKPAGAYVPAQLAGNLLFTSGQLPMRDGRLMAEGLVGRDVTVEEARACAEQCILNCLAAAATVCDLDLLEQVVKVTGYVASADKFTSQPAVIDAASELLGGIFGAAGPHAREAVGVKALPLGSPVEISVILSVRPD